MPYIGKHGVEALRRYKYSGVDRSLLAKYVLNHIWAKFVNVFPIWLAPNLITLIGFAFVVLSTGLAYWYCPLLNTPQPPVIYFLHGLLLFLYQTFDAVDGKQARRTNSSSPLGELFDHGCDALVVGLETLVMSSTVTAGKNVLWWWLPGCVPFFFATWETFHTGRLALGYINGPVEGLFLMYTAYAMTAFVGPAYWNQDVRQLLGLSPAINGFPGIELKYAALGLMTTAGLLPTLTLNCINVNKAVKAKGADIWEAYFQILPFLALVGLVWGWAAISPTDVVGNHPFLLMLGTMFTLGFFVGRMVLAHLADEPKGLKTHMSISMWVLPLALANALSAQVLDGTPLFDEFVVLVVYCAYSAALYFHFAVSVVHEITAALQINCFSIKRQAHRTS